KVQGGGGVEYLVLPQLGIKLFAEYNHIFDDELDGLEFGATDDIYWRMAFGLNWYFGRHDRSKKLSSDQPTVIESNPIVDDY
ncbi:MAG: Curli production assembly/transport component CsgG, partial [Bacteroidia bacterium]|nr:Curli production assembly/transport component CsgG [Bacteroidia bacterium]